MEFVGHSFHDTWEGITRSLFLSLPHTTLYFNSRNNSRRENVRPPPLLVTNVHIKHFSFIETEPADGEELVALWRIILITVLLFINII